MAVAFDSVVDLGSGTGDLSGTLSPVGTLAGVGVLIVQQQVGSPSDQVTSVTADAVALVEAPLSPFVALAGSEDGVVYGYFLGSGVPAGDLSMVVTVGAATVKHAIAFGVTASGDTAVEDTNTLDQDLGADPSVALATAAETLLVGANHSGLGALPVNKFSGYTELGSFDFGNQVALYARKDANEAAGTPTFQAWDIASDEAHIYVMAIKEVVESTQLDGVTLITTPVLPAARIDLQIAGAVLAIIPSFPAASISAAGSVTAPTLTTVPTFPQARVDLTVAGAVLTVTPTLPAASIAAGQTVTAVTLSATPTFPQATVQGDQPIPVIRGSSKLFSQSSTTITVDVDTTCTGYKYLVMYVSRGGANPLGQIDNITSDNGGFTGFEVIPYSGHGSAFPTGVATGPRGGWLVELQGDVEAGDTLTITMEQSCEEWAVFVLDEPGGVGITHVQPTTSMANTNAATIHHQARTHSSSGIRALLWTGGGTDEPNPDEGTELDEWAFSAGISGGSLLYKNGDFTGYKVDWTWVDDWSNQGIVWEVYTAASDGGAAAHVEHIENWTDTSGSATSGAFIPNAGDVIVLVSTFERNPPTDPTSVQDNQGSPAAYTLVTDGTTDAKVDPDATHRTTWYSHRYASSPGSVTVSFSHATISGSVHSLERLVGAPGSTDTDWVGEVDVATNDAATSIAGALSSLDAASGVLASVSADAATEDIDFEDGFVPIRAGDDAGVGSETQAQLVVWLGDDQDASPAFSVAGSARDLAIVAVEVLGVSDQTLTAATLTVAPSLPAAQVTHSVLGATLVVVPTLPQATLGGVVGGATLQVTPSFPAASLAHTLTGTTLTVTPTFPAAALGGVLGAVTLQVTPTLPVGQLAHQVVATVLTVTPTLPAANLASAGIVTGVTLLVVPVFPLGELDTGVLAYWPQTNEPAWAGTSGSGWSQTNDGEWE